MSDSGALRTRFPVEIDGVQYEGSDGQSILETMMENGIEHPHVCYHSNLGPIQTCDTCMVEVGGEIVRACSTMVTPGMKVETTTRLASAARTEAMDRILENHMLYCTVCDNNNGNCVLHNTAELMKIEHQRYPYRPKGYEKTCPIRFIDMIPTSAYSVDAVSRRVKTFR
ncbi:hypothetical protein GCM10025859_31690 [Alicyclobacillus fastidiosus]|nr:hypothetical protein GCM10025859_31690 [Alicyclobacillus fastidiosus]